GVQTCALPISAPSPPVQSLLVIIQRQAGRWSSRLAPFADQIEDFRRRLGDIAARPEDGGNTRIIERLIVLRRDNAAADNQNVLGALLFQLGDNLWDQGLVTGRERGNADDMNVILDRVLRRFRRRLEERPDIDVKADIGEGGRDHLGAAVMAVLPDFDDQHAGTASLFSREGLDIRSNLHEPLISFVSGAVDTGNRADFRPVTGKDLFHRIGNLANRRPRPRRIDAELQQVSVAFGAFGEGIERRLTGRLIAVCADFLKTGDLLAQHFGVIDIENFDIGVVLLKPVFVDADDDFLAAVDAGLTARCRFLNTELRHATFDRLGHAAHFLDLLDQLPSLFNQ